LVAPTQVTIEGRVERLDTEVVSGWALDPGQPDQPVDVALRIDGELVAIAKANRFAARLRNNQRNGHHGFFFYVPPTCYSGTHRQVQVEVLNAGIELPAPVNLLAFPLVTMPRLADEAQTQPASNYTPDWQSDYAHYVVKPMSTTRKRSSDVRVTMIMLNWNGEQLLQDFFTALHRHPPALRYELLIVDHGSTDGSLDLIRSQVKRLPITLIARDDNYPFADSNNLAAIAAKGDLLMFLNNDLVWQHDCVSVMAQVLDDPQIGIVGARLLEPIREANGLWSFVVHHEGIRFRPSALPQNGGDYYAAREVADIPADLAASVIRVPAVTAALMMCRKNEFRQVGGFCNDYVYGMEDVDFCLEFSRKLGKHIVVALQASAIHNRSATRDLKTTVQPAPRSYNAATHVANHKTFIRRQGAALTGTVLRSLLASSKFYRREPLRVVFAVTEAGIETSAGDFYTALELGKALEGQFGWEIFFVEKGTQAIPGADVLVAMRHDFQLRNIHGANPGLVTAAWIRNRTDEWLLNDCFSDYQVVFASSEKIVEHVREYTGRDAVLLPIATNPDRFSPDRTDAAHISDVVFTGNNHGVVRGGLALLAPNGKDYVFALYGHRWENSKRYRRFHRGALSYDNIAKAYASSKLVLDDAHAVTNDWDSLNSRVFDGIACGKVVVTNCVGGARALFGDKLPVYSTAGELRKQVNALLGSDRKRNQLARELRRHVLENHTYAHRAATVRQALISLTAPGRLRWAIKVPVPKESEKQLWGDYHFALGIRRELERRGHVVRIDLLPEWQAGTGVADDVVLVLRGLSRYKPRPTTTTLLWLVSHPDSITTDEMREYDHVFVASTSYAAKLAAELGSKVSPLLQCTDPQLFHPEPKNDLTLPPVLFIGNSRGHRREVVDNALGCGVHLGIYGTGWGDKLPAGVLLGEHVPNTELRRFYSSATVVLNDHWPDMRREGFLSNRLFDAGACGAVILSDAAKGLRELFGAALPTYDSPDSFRQQLSALLADSARRKALSAEVRQCVLAGHTFEHRISVMLNTIKTLQKTG
jgi:GT2 family glycosyltransferase/spore maturation protein CgeB